MSDQGWFRPKRVGYGSGMPCSWQGWLILTVYMTIVTGGSILLADKPLAVIAFIAPLTILFLIICAKTTVGGWRWRRGEDD